MDGESDLLDGRRNDKAGARGPPERALLSVWGHAITVIVRRLPVLSVKLWSPAVCWWRRWCWIQSEEQTRRCGLNPNRHSGKPDLAFSQHNMSLYVEKSATNAMKGCTAAYWGMNFSFISYLNVSPFILNSSALRLYVLWKTHFITFYSIFKESFVAVVDRRRFSWSELWNIKWTWDLSYRQVCENDLLSTLFYFTEMWRNDLIGGVARCPVETTGRNTSLRKLTAGTEQKKRTGQSERSM